MGGRRVDGKIEYPIIGNSVTIYPGARIIGGITVGDNAIVGPNTVLFENLGPGEIAVSAKYQTIVKKIRIRIACSCFLCCINLNFMYTVHIKPGFITQKPRHPACN